MKKKKHNPDFFSHARSIVGDKKFESAIKRGEQEVRKLRLKKTREMLGVTQDQMKGILQPEVSKIERRSDLKVSTLQKYATALGMKLKIFFVSDTEDDEPISIYG